MVRDARTMGPPAKKVVDMKQGGERLGLLQGAGLEGQGCSSPLELPK